MINFIWKVAAVDLCRKLNAFLGDDVKTERVWAYYSGPRKELYLEPHRWKLIHWGLAKAFENDKDVEIVPAYDLQELDKGAPQHLSLWGSKSVDGIAKTILHHFEMFRETGLTHVWHSAGAFKTNYNKEK
jgi:hypothetical protein